MAHKRANNEGTIYFHKTRNRWCAQISLLGHRLTKYGRSQRECLDWINEMQSRIESGLTYESTKVALQQFADSWLAGKKLSRRPGTVHQYRQIFDQYILPLIGKMRLQEVQPSLIRRLYLTKREEGLGSRTIQLIHTVLHSMFKQAVREGLLGWSPVEAVERPKVETAEHQILTEEQAQQLVIMSKASHYGTLIYLALITGLRESELLGLKWSDIDWKKGILHVQRQLHRVQGQGRVFVPPKTKAGRREIRLGQGTLERLAAHREEQDKQRILSGDLWEENNLIFPNRLGKPAACENMYKEHKRILKANGLPDIRFHGLRHTNISFLIDMGTPINTVQKRAGHSKASITTDTYGHSITRSEREAAERIDEWISPVAVKSQSK